MCCSIGYAELRGKGELPNSKKACGKPNHLKAGNFQLFSFQTVNFQVPAILVSRLEELFIHIPESSLLAKGIAFSSISNACT